MDYFDLPADLLPWQQTFIPAADRLLQLLTLDANCQLRLHRAHFSPQTLFLINQFNANSQLQQDLHQLWLRSLKNLIPQVIHRDEALAEALMMKQPVGAASACAGQRRDQYAGQLDAAACRRRWRMNALRWLLVPQAAGIAAARAPARQHGAGQLTVALHLLWCVAVAAAAGNAGVAARAAATSALLPHISPLRPRPLDIVRYALQSLWLLIMLPLDGSARERKRFNAFGSLFRWRQQHHRLRSCRRGWSTAACRSAANAGCSACHGACVGCCSS